MRTRLALLLLAGFAVLWLAAMGLVLAGAHLPASAGGRVLVVFLSGRADAAQRIAAAGGIPLEPFGPLGWTAYSRTEGFAGRLRERGAALVVPPLGELGFAAICGAGMDLLAARPKSAQIERWTSTIPTKSGVSSTPSVSPTAR